MRRLLPAPLGPAPPAPSRLRATPAESESADRAAVTLARLAATSRPHRASCALDPLACVARLASLAGLRPGRCARSGAPTCPHCPFLLPTPADRAAGTHGQFPLLRLLAACCQAAGCWPLRCFSGGADAEGRTQRLGHASSPGPGACIWRSVCYMHGCAGLDAAAAYPNIARRQAGLRATTLRPQHSSSLQNH